MLQTQSNTPSFGAKLTRNAVNIIKQNGKAIAPQTRRAIADLRHDKETNKARIDIVTKKRQGKDVFSFVIHPENTVAKILPHHPYFKVDPKSVTGLKAMPRRVFFWKSLDEMFKSDILSPQKLKKTMSAFFAQHDLIDRWLKTQPGQKSMAFSAKIGRKIAEMQHLTEVKK